MDVRSRFASRSLREGTPFRRLILLAAVASSLMACGDDGNGDDGDGDGELEANVLLRDENNYSSMSSLTIPTIETASATDLEICWSEAVQDIQCHDVDPVADLDTVALTRFARLSEDQVEARLTAGEVKQAELGGYLEYHTDHESTCTKLSNLSFFGTEIEIEEEYVESSDVTYMLVLAQGTTPGVGARTMAFIKPTESSTNTQVDVGSGCGILEFSANLSEAEPVPIPVDGPWVIDWRGVARDGQGNDVVPQSISKLLLGFYAGMTVPELQEQILDLELIATSLWEIELTGGRTADLAKAKPRSGSGSFSGFDQDEDGVWVLGLMCGACQNPAPIVLSILEPVSE